MDARTIKGDGALVAVAERIATATLVVRGHSAVANSCVALPGGRFASVGRDRMLVIWDGGGRIERQVSSPHQHSIRALAASGDTILTGDYRGTVGVYSMGRGQYVRTLRVSETGISRIAAGPDGTAFASSYDGRAYRVAA